MIVLPNWGPAPPAVGVNENVAAERVFPATRSLVATIKFTDVTMPPITPEATPATEARTSTLVCTVTSPPAVAIPILSPERVTVTGTLAENAVPDLVMTMEVAPGTAAVSVAPLTLVAAVGVTDVSKKPFG